MRLMVEPAQSQKTGADRTTLSASLAAAVFGGLLIFALWPAPQSPLDRYAVNEFVDEISGRQQLIADLGDVPLMGLPQGARAWIELRAQGPAPVEAGSPLAGIALIVEANEPTLLELPLRSGVTVGPVQGPIRLRRVEVSDQGKIISGLHGEVPWPVLIGLATGAAGALIIDDQALPMGKRSQAQALALLRRLKALGFTFSTFELDLDLAAAPTPEAASVPNE